MVLTRRIDAEAIALQRQGELGIWASCLGQEAAQVGSGRAMLSQDYAFPTYREHGVAWCRGVDPAAAARPVPRGRHGRLGLGRQPGFHLYTIVIGSQALHATGYAMGVERDGLVGTGDPDRDTAVIGYFGDGATSQGDVNEAFVFASSYNAPIVFFLPEQPVGDLRADRAAVADPVVPPGGRLRLPGRTGGRQRRAGGARRHHRGAGTGPLRQRADADRGLHLSDGRAHHLRRSDQVPAGRRAGALAAEGPDRAGPGLPVPARCRRRRLLRRGRGGGRRAGGHPAPRVPRRCRSRRWSRLFDAVYAEQTPYLAEQQAAYAEYLATFEDGRAA